MEHNHIAIFFRILSYLCISLNCFLVITVCYSNESFKITLENNICFGKKKFQEMNKIPLKSDLWVIRKMYKHSRLKVRILDLLEILMYSGYIIILQDKLTKLK